MKMTPHKHTPWGSYDILASAQGFKVKRLTVHPDEKLSLQAHQYRSEHWTVVKGIATVTIDDTTSELTVSQSIDIPKHVLHRLENRHQDILEIIEVQFGDYLEEDDIIRYDDIYGRV